MFRKQKKLIRSTNRFIFVEPYVIVFCCGITNSTKERMSEPIGGSD